MNESPAFRCGLFEGLELLFHQPALFFRRYGAGKGNLEDMNWIVEHAKAPGADPVLYGRALCTVLNTAQVLGQTDIVAKTIETFETIEWALDKCKRMSLAIRVQNIRQDYQRKQSTFSTPT